VAASIAIVSGTLLPDGTLELEGKVNLPAGRVQVTLVPMPELPRDDPFWMLMQRIWSGQGARGHIPRSRDEVEAERRMVREQWDERMARIHRTQEDARILRAEDGAR
jgi:hypothetical protein